MITNAAPMFLGDSVPEFDSEEDSEETGSSLESIDDFFSKFEEGI